MKVSPVHIFIPYKSSMMNTLTISTLFTSLVSALLGTPYFGFEGHILFSDMRLQSGCFFARPPHQIFKRVAVVEEFPIQPFGSKGAACSAGFEFMDPRDGPHADGMLA